MSRAAVAIAALAFNGVSAQECALPAAPSCGPPRTPMDYVASRLAPSVYDMSDRPTCEGGGPTVVEVQLRLKQLNKIDVKGGAIAFKGYLKMWWTDPRLNFTGIADGGCLDSVVLEPAEIAHVWTPDLYIDNIDSIAQYEPSALLQVRFDGQVYYSRELHASVKIRFDLGKLPYDKHTASITFASYSKDISKLRLVPRGGSQGPGSSGVGISSVPLASSSWKFTADPEGDGFETPGVVAVEEEKDHLTLQFPFERKRRFFQVEVMFPSMIFLMLAYMQFFVDPNAAPARAMLACVPVLIMRTLSNSVYAMLPESAQQMWIADILTSFTMMCSLVAVEYGFVQYCLVMEKNRQAKRTGLKQTAPVAKKLIEQARRENCKLSDLLKKYQTMETAQLPKSRMREGAAASSGAGAADADDLIDMHLPSKEAHNHQLWEHDLLFLKYAAQKFADHDKDGSHALAPEEVRKLLQGFNIYMSTAWVAEVICMYLRDLGRPTPVDQLRAVIDFSTLCGLLIDMDSYMLITKRNSWLGWFQSMSLSQTVDLVCRVLWPVALIMVLIIFQLCLPNY